MWRQCLTYPQCVPSYLQETLDALESLLGPPDGPDRYVALSRFLAKGVESGLISRVECASIRSTLAPEM